MDTQVPVIALDGNESITGRALLCLSALYHCADRLHHVGIRLIDVTDPNVLLAAEALHWDIGLQLDAWPAERARSDGSPLADVALYAGIACGSARHMRLEEARQLQIPTFLAMQFPEQEWLSPAIVLRQDAAFDPRKFAEGITRIVERWGCDRAGP